MSVRYPSRVEFRVLGPLEVVEEGETRKLGGLKQRSILALLLANVGRPVSLAGIVDDVYGDEATPGIRRSVMTFVSSLRRDLGVEIGYHDGSYLLEVDPGAIDAVVFERALDANRARIGIDPKQAGRDLNDALQMWRGHPYADVEVRGALQPEVTRLLELRLAALEMRIDADLAAGRGPQLVAELEVLADEHPLRERFRAQHMLALYRAGRQVDALRAFRRTEQHLSEHFGLEPSAELRELELRILQQDPDLLRGDSQRLTQQAAILVCALGDTAPRWDLFPEAMANALATFDRLCTEAITDAGGRVFRRGADGVIASFVAVPDAMRAAESAQRHLTEHDWDERGALIASMGIDVGDVESYGGEFIGPPVIRAMRIAAAGHPGQVLISSSAQRQLVETGTAGAQFLSLGEFNLRGQVEPERIGQLVFQGLPATFPVLRPDVDIDLEGLGRYPWLPGYEVRELIGEGVHSRVYRAYQPSVGREVAVKVIRPEYSRQPEFVRQFENKARTVARIAHPHIVPLYDFWRDADGAYVVMRLFPNGSLNTAKASQPPDLATAAKTIRQIGDALAFAHAHGVTHGNLTSDKVMLDESGNAYVSGLGITPELVEVEAGAGSHPKDWVLADQSAFGALTYEILTGQIADPERRIEPPSAIRTDVPAAVDEVVGRATARTAPSRYPTIAAMVEAFEQALAPVVAPATDEPEILRNPYKGLRAFDEGDVDDFYGREDLVASLLECVAARRFVTVVGPSGSGKSSAVRAGLLPALRAGAVDGAEGWFTATMVPGPEPLRSLARAVASVSTLPADATQLITARGLAAAAEELLADDTGDLLLVIDQFDELFTLAPEAERQEFVDVLVAAVKTPGSRVRVVTTLRADLYDRPLAYEGLDRLVGEGQVTVLRPTRDELIEMIGQPAERVGLRWEPGLPEHIAEQVQGRPGALPLLQYALTELVERRDGALLTTGSYELIGGAGGALAARAEAAYLDMTVRQRATAQEIMFRLLTIGEEGVSRRRVRRSELDSLALDQAELEEVVGLLITRRMLVTDRDPITRGPTVEVAHEALLESWPRLRQWIDTRRSDLEHARRFRAAAAEWEQSGRDQGYLLTGSRLALYLGWAEESVLSADEQAFLDASVDEAQAEERLRTRRRRLLTGSFAASALVALVLATFALSERGRAVEQAQLAQGRALAATASSLLERDPELALLLAVEGVELDPGNATHISVLHEAIQRSRAIFSLSWDPEYTPWGLMTGTMSLDGRLVAAAAFGTRLEVWQTTDAVSPLWSKEFPGVHSEVMDVHFSPGGDTVAVFVRWSRWAAAPPPTGYVDSIYVLDAQTGAELGKTPAPECFEGLIPVGDQLEERGRLLGVRAQPVDYGCDNWTLEGGWVDLASGRFEVLTQPVGYQEVGWAAATDDGRFLAIGMGGPGQIIDTETGEALYEYSGGVAVSAGGGPRFLTGGLDVQAIELWDATSGSVMEFGIDEEVAGAAATPDGSSVFVFGAGGTVYRFDASSGVEMLRARTSDAAIVHGIPSSDGNRVAVFYADGTMQVIDVALPARGEVATFNVIPDGGRFVSSMSSAEGLVSIPTLEWWSGRSRVDLVDTDSGRVIRTLAAAFDAPLATGGDLIAVQPMLDDVELDTAVAGEGYEGTYQRIAPIQVVDTFSGEVMVQMDGLCEWFNSPSHEVPGSGCGTYPEPFADYGRLAFSADGSRLALAGWLSQSVSVWDAKSGAMLWNSGPIEEEWSALDVAFTPDGDNLVVGSKTRMQAFDAGSFDTVAVVDLEDNVHAIAFSGDGQTMYLGTSQEVLVFSTAGWVEVDRFYTNGAFDLAVSPDGSHLAVGTRFEEVVIFDTATGARRQVMRFPGIEFPANLGFVTNHHLLVAAVGSEPAMLMTIEPHELIDAARSVATRVLTSDECSTYELQVCGTSSRQSES